MPLNNSFERDVCYAAAPHTPLKLGVIRKQLTSMNKSEELVVNELLKNGLVCQPFSKPEIKQGKTPDYRVYKDNEFGFFCEVKEIKKDDWYYGLRNDPIFNRLTDDIHTAVKQFNSVNPDNAFPNVLAFVNNDRKCGSLDLLGVLTGGLLLENGGWADIYHKFSDGRIKNEKNIINLYLWFDAFKANKVLFNQKNDKHLNALCRYFEIDPNSIKPIGV